MNMSMVKRLGYLICCLWMTFGTALGFSNRGYTSSPLATMEARLSRLEGQIRDLNGQVEELIHAIRESRKAQQVGSEQSGATPLKEPEFSILSQQSSQSLPPTDLGMKDRGSDSTEISKTSLFPRSHQILPSGPIQSAYEYAMGLLARHEYDRAELAFKEILRRFSEDPLVVNAYYWLGETYLQRNQFSKAAAAFGGAYQIYEKQKKENDSKEGSGYGALGYGKAAESLLKLAISLKALGQPQDACAALNELVKQFPHMRVTLRRMADRLSYQLEGCSLPQNPLTSGKKGAGSKTPKKASGTDSAEALLNKEHPKKEVSSSSHKISSETEVLEMEKALEAED